MKSITQLPAAAALTGGETMPADQATQTVKVTPAQLRDYVNAYLESCGLRCANNVTQLKHPLTGKWHTLTVTGADGQSALAISAAGEN